MKALICGSFGLPVSLQLEEVKQPDIQPDEVLIKVYACGISFPDLLIIQNKYQFKPNLPFSPGGEIAGIVEAVGKNVKKITAGDRVFALCKWGGVAEKAAVKSKFVYPLPPTISFIHAACYVYTYSTAYYALKNRAALKKGETLLVLGAGGGVGSAAVDLGKIMGGKVIAAASTNEKLSIGKSHGATWKINYSTEDLRTRVKEITQQKGVDVVFDTVGGEYAEQALRAIAWKGRYLVVGFASGIIPSFSANLPLLKGCSIVGVFWSHFSQVQPNQNKKNIAQLLQYLTNGLTSPRIHKIYSLSQAPLAFNDLINRHIVGKAVIKMNDELVL